MIKKRMVCICAIMLLLFSSCGSTNIVDRFAETELTKEIAQTIVHSFNSAQIDQPFSTSDVVPYEMAFKYFRYFGFYNEKGEMRPQVVSYQDGLKYKVPRKVVDTYLSSKFNTTPSAKSISCYDAQSDSYVIAPVDSYAGKITIDSIDKLDNNQYQIHATVQDEPTETLFSFEQTFTIEYNGSFKFLSFEEKEKAFQELTAEEQKLLSYINDYYFFDTRQYYDEDHKIPYDVAFKCFAIYGFWDNNGALRKELKQYATGNEYEDPYNIPAKIVDDFVASRFDVEIDRSNIENYNKESDSYLILPNAADGHDFAELISYERSGNIYRIIVNQRNWLDPNLVEKQMFRLEINDENCKYLAFTKI